MKRTVSTVVYWLLTGVILSVFAYGCSDSNSGSDGIIDGDQEQELPVTDGDGSENDVSSVDGDSDSVLDDVCDPNPCKDHNRTTCLPGDDGSHSCECDGGFRDYGDGECKLSEPCATDDICEDLNRHCTNNNGVTECGDCLPGFHEEDDDCTADEECSETSCNNRGDCDDSNGWIACDCETGYAGDYCENCDEAANWHWNGVGDACTTDPCDPDPCDASTHRVCDRGSLGQCICEPDYCDINGICVHDGLSNPENLCQKCDSSNNTNSWSPKPSTVLCRPAVGSCDIPDYCDETGGICPEDAMMPDQDSGIACGLNGRGDLVQVCIDGYWSISQQCADPDYCIDGIRRLGVTACGFNGRGVLEQLCEGGYWSNTDTCNDPDVCTDDDTRNISCGLNGRGSYSQGCIHGHWRSSEACQDPDVCRDGTARAVTCQSEGHTGSKPQACANGFWEDNGECVVTIDVQVVVEETEVTNGLVHFTFVVQEPVVEAELFLDSESIGQAQNLMGRFTLPTNHLADGSHSIQIWVRSADGREGEGESLFIVDNPSVSITAFEAPETVYPGYQVDIEVKAEGAVTDIEPDFSEMIDGFQQGTVSFATLGGGWYRARYTLPSVIDADEAWYAIPVDVVGSDGSRIRLEDIRVFLASGEPMLLRHEYATYSPESLPEERDLWASADIDSFPSSMSIITGGEADLAVSVSGVATGATLLLSVRGMGGHLVYSLDALRNLQRRTRAGESILPDVPLRPKRPVERPPSTRSGESFVIPIHLPNGALPDNAQGTWILEYGIADSQGRIAHTYTSTLTYAEAQAGNLRVSLAWDTPTDVDLHVVEPSSEEIYYSHRNSSTGGYLDLDSNPACNLDNVNQENVFWELPPSGEYIVRVDYWSACGSYPANYRVTVTGCGVEEVRTRRFESYQADGGGAGSGTEVLRFTANCGGYKVSGKAEYNGYSVTGMERTFDLEGVPIRVVSSNGIQLNQHDAVVGPNGNYSIPFDWPVSGATSPVHLEVYADSDWVRVEKQDHSLQRYTSSEWDPASIRDKILTFTVPVNSKSGAFHIFKKAKSGHDWYRAKGRILTEKSIFVWDSGIVSPFCEGNSCYWGRTNRIYIGGDLRNPDEFDDSVILHELGHRAVDVLEVKDDNPGEEHVISARSDPCLAWNEGLVTFLAQLILDNRNWVNRNSCRETENGYSCGFFVFPIDRIHSIPEGLGTDPEFTAAGLISEALVTAALWDLHDPTEENGPDRFSGLENVVLQVVFDHLNLDAENAGNFDWGVGEKADFADFVGLFGCSLTGDAFGNFRDLLNERYQLDWLTLPSFCGEDEE